MDMVLVDSEGSDASLSSPTRWAHDGAPLPGGIVRQGSGGDERACLDPLTPRAAARRCSAAVALRAAGRPWTSVDAARRRARITDAADDAVAAPMQLKSLSSSGSSSSTGSAGSSSITAPNDRRGGAVPPPAPATAAPSTAAAAPAPEPEPVNIRHGRLQFSGDKREVVNEQACRVSDSHVAPWAIVRARRDQYQSMCKPSYRFARLEGRKYTQPHLSARFPGRSLRDCLCSQCARRSTS